MQAVQREQAIEEPAAARPPSLVDVVHHAGDIGGSVPGDFHPVEIAGANALVAGPAAVFDPVMGVEVGMALGPPAGLSLQYGEPRYSYLGDHQR
jgi:hypothetical protein